MSSGLKTILGIIVLVLVVAGGWWALKQKPVSETGTVKIGLILPLTGELAFLGEAGKNGAELALEEINADPSLKHKYELVIEDDALDAKRTASALNKLMSVDSVDVVVSVSSGSGNVVTPIAEQSKLPHIGLASDLNVAKGDFNFIHWTQPPEEVDAMLAELERRNLRRVAVIGVSQQGFKAIATDFKAKAAAKGITVVSDQEFNPGVTDFKTVISQSEAQNPDIYLLGAFSPEVEILAKQIKELGITKPLTSIESFGLSNSPEVFEGYWFVDAAVTEGGFNDKYRAKYGKEVGPTSGNLYDAVHLIVEATEAAGENPDGTAIARELAKLNSYSGAFGQLTVNPEGAFISQASVKVIRDGKAVMP